MHQSRDAKENWFAWRSLVKKTAENLVCFGCYYFAKLNASTTQSERKLVWKPLSLAGVYRAWVLDKEETLRSWIAKLRFQALTEENCWKFNLFCQFWMLFFCKIKCINNTKRRKIGLKTHVSTPSLTEEVVKQAENLICFRSTMQSNTQREGKLVWKPRRLTLIRKHKPLLC